MANIIIKIIQFLFRICGLLISNNHISIAVVDHPYKEYRSLKKLYNLPYISNSYHNRTHGKEVFRKTLETTLRKFNVIGFAVSWPLEPWGHPGFECGRTLHVLDYLAGE
jgi:hypothetical protein